MPSLVTVLEWLAFAVTIPVLTIMVAQNLVYVVQLVATFRERMAEPICIGTQRDLWQLQSRHSLPVSIIAPAYNEELTITDSVRSLLSVNYPHIEVIVVNDGSKDDTIGTLIRNFNLVPRARPPVSKLSHEPIRRVYQSIDHANLIVVDKENGRKADAINAGISIARHPLVCVIDADSLIDVDAMLRATQPFLADDGSVVAVGGAIRLTNGCDIGGGRLHSLGMPRDWIARFQILEYLRAFMVARVSASRWGMLLLISGAFGLFRREAVIEAGGYMHGTVGEDLELTVRLQRIAREKGRKSRVVYVADALCWTEAPFNFAGIKNQRSRWTQGGVEVLWHHRDMLFNPRFGRIGLIGLPLVLLETALVPLAEVCGYLLVPILWYLGTDKAWLLFGTLCTHLLFGTLISLGALFFEEVQMRRHNSLREIALLISCAFLENAGYRQANSWFRLRGIRSFLKKETAWATVQRQGFVAQA